MPTSFARNRNICPHKKKFEKIFPTYGRMHHLQLAEIDNFPRKLIVHFPFCCAPTTISKNCPLILSFSVIGQYRPITEQLNMADEIFIEYLFHFSATETAYNTDRSDP